MTDFEWKKKDQEAGSIQQKMRQHTPPPPPPASPLDLRSGKWGGLKEEIPHDVKLQMSSMWNYGSDIDWVSFKSEDGQMWLVAKLYEDEDTFSVVAAVIKKEEFECEF
jgi:hypothetical protein